MTRTSDVGLIGLAVMGRNLVLNLEEKGFGVSVYNRSYDKTAEFIATEAAHKNIFGFNNIKDFLLSLPKPRRIFLMIKAGEPVDAMIAELLPFLDENDIIIDAGNSLFSDSMRREKMLQQHKILFVGMGVSGGEEGARHGPSLMPGGSFAAWPYLQPICEKIAARVDNIPCCAWIGPQGSGHFVKMVHNGIEYGDMAIIAEAYHLMRDVLHLNNKQIGKIFSGWNEGVLNSYLIEITANIFNKYDDNNNAIIDVILDAALQKGTGKWMVEAAMDYGIPITLITESVFSRSLSALIEERVYTSTLFDENKIKFSGDTTYFLEALKSAVYASKIVSYAQGFMLLDAASKANKWNLDKANIALLWRGGCIIRSKFLNDISSAYKRDLNLKNLIHDQFFLGALQSSSKLWRYIISQAVQNAIAVPAMSSALAFFDGYKCARSPANLIQAQRDYFGAHTFERVDAPRGKAFHANWLEANNTKVEEV